VFRSLRCLLDADVNGHCASANGSKEPSRPNETSLQLPGEQVPVLGERGTLDSLALTRRRRSCDDNGRLLLVGQRGG
ncbi:hypothetical protein E2562_010298, partial [Oryza meyeriana var. granulata]